MLKLLLNCLLVFFFVFCIDGRLLLMPNEKFLELNSSDSIQLACIGPSRKSWNYPRKELLSTSKGLTEVSNVNIEQSLEDPDKSTLFLSKASYNDTGTYQCLSGNDSVRIYVFVRDENHLMMDASRFYLDAHEFSNFTLPCKPTARDVTMKLVKKVKKKIKEFGVGDETPFTGSPVEYDIEKGFILPFVTSEVKGKSKCIATRGETKQVIEFNIAFLPFTDGFNTPHIVANKTFVIVGDSLELDCELLEEGAIHFKSPVWDVPEKVKDFKQEKTSFSEGLIDNKTMRYHNILLLKNVAMDHGGEYTCTLMDAFYNVNKAKYHLKVHPKFTTFLNLTSDDAPVKMVPPSTTEQSITVRIDANPSVDKVVWYFTNRKQKNIQIFDDRKYKIESIHENNAILIIKFPELDDSGTYRFTASNGKTSSYIDIKVYVEALPKILGPLNPFCENMQVSSGSFLFKYKTLHEISCLSIGYPKPTVSWYFQEFSTFPRLSGENPLKIHSSNFKNFETNASLDITTESRLEGISLKSGVLYCKSCNIFGCREANISFLVTDMKMGFDTWGNENLISGDDGSIHCGASRFVYGPGLTWSYKKLSSLSHKHDMMYLNDSNFLITDMETELSYLSTIVLKNVTTNLTGLYTCEAETLTRYKKQSAISMIVSPSSFPVLLNTTTMNNGTRHLENDASIDLLCDAGGLPKPRVVWFYNNKEIKVLLETRAIDRGRISLIDGDMKLKILHATEAESGNYTCKAINRLGSVSAHSTLIVAGVKIIWPWIIFSTVFIIVILSIVIIILYQRVRHEKALLRELTKTVLETFDDGAEGDLNPELGIVEQADLLPYKKQYEFPRENLKLGKQLGSGAFGVVLKAEANGIVKENEVTTVAVKMLKQNVEVSHIKALTTELKVMIHLGKHLNVVNLLGACTRNLNNRELLVIVEYCKYGNMHDYLRRNRNNFINQINPKTGLFDSNLIGTRITETERKRLFPSQSTSASYTGATHSDSSVTFYSNCTVMTDFYSNQLEANPRLVHNYKNLAVDPLDEEDDYIVSRDLLPALKPQSKGEHEFCTEDLLCWGFQTACGMEYLVSRKVLHGDLAARNILLAENNVIKICDFGMSKNMNYEDNYCKKGKQLLPVKWLSIEAMRDREFSVYSDIWSFGVALWEFFSLARTPYPGIDGVQDLYKKLESGYRMERPAFAPDVVYRIMLECWHEEPKRRPSFTDLAARLGYMIDRDVQKHFLNLSEELLKSNEEDFDENDCLIQPSNVEYQNLIEKKVECSSTKNNKAMENTQPLELKHMAQNRVDSDANLCGFSNQTYGNVDLQQNIPSVNVQLV